MKPYYAQDNIELYHADFRELPAVRDGSVRADCVMADPPYGETSLAWDVWPDGWPTGELGEAANLIKKIRRGDITLDEARPELAKELADVQTYLDILAFRAGVDLGEATREKFNEVSDRVGCNVKL